MKQHLCKVALCTAFLALLSLPAPLAAQAASLQVYPVRVTLDAKHPTAVIHLVNQGSTSTVIQCNILAWSQPNGKNAFAATRDLLATPPIFSLAAGATQVVRVGLLGAPPPGREQAYRLFLTQVPPAPEVDRTGLRLALRLSLPVFVTPTGKPAAGLQWSASLASPTSLVLRATNVGTEHVQVLDLTLSPPKPTKPIHRQSGDYLLPGTTASWDIKLESPLAAGTKLGVSAKTDQGGFHAEVSAAPESSAAMPASSTGGHAHS